MVLKMSEIPGLNRNMYAQNSARDIVARQSKLFDGVKSKSNLKMDDVKTYALDLGANTGRSYGGGATSSRVSTVLKPTASSKGKVKPKPVDEY